MEKPHDTPQVTQPNALPNVLPGELNDLYEAARSAREFSYSPYSKCKVGAAIRTANGKIYSGCNVENSSYGATNCAERVAIQKAVSETKDLRITEVMVVTDTSPPWPPCGMCRQVIAEFGVGIQIHAANLAGELTSAKFEAIFPDAFTREHLK